MLPRNGGNHLHVVIPEDRNTNRDAFRLTGMVSGATEHGDTVRKTHGSILTRSVGSDFTHFFLVL
jgi:hypothetical protein